MYQVLFLFCILFYGSASVAQPYFDLLNIHYQKSPDAAFYGKDKNSFQTDYLHANVNLPVKIFRKDVLLINPVYEWNRLAFPGADFIDIDLYGITLAITYVKQWNSVKWKTAFVSVNRLSSDLKKITLKHYQPGGAILMIYERSEKIKYKLGIFYNAEFFGAFVLPLAGIDWKMSNRFTLHGIVPRNLALEYKLSSKIYLGINWKAITGSFRFDSENENDYFKIEENQWRLFADFYVAKNLVFNVEGGHSFLRSYNLRSELQRKVGADADLLVNDGFLFKAGIYYRIRMNEKKEL